MKHIDCQMYFNYLQWLPTEWVTDTLMKKCLSFKSNLKLKPFSFAWWCWSTGTSTKAQYHRLSLLYPPILLTHKKRLIENISSDSPSCIQHERAGNTWRHSRSSSQYIASVQEANSCFPFQPFTHSHICTHTHKRFWKLKECLFLPCCNCFYSFAVLILLIAN